MSDSAIYGNTWGARFCTICGGTAIVHTDWDGSAINDEGEIVDRNMYGIQCSNRLCRVFVAGEDRDVTVKRWNEGDVFPPDPPNPRDRVMMEIMLRLMNASAEKNEEAYQSAKRELLADHRKRFIRSVH